MTDNLPTFAAQRRQQRLDALAGGSYRPPLAVSCLSAVFLTLSVGLIVGVLGGWLSHPIWVVVLVVFAAVSIVYARFLMKKQRESRRPTGLPEPR